MGRTEEPPHDPATLGLAPCGMSDSTKETLEEVVEPGAVRVARGGDGLASMMAS
jgi:hypothetical protein